MASRCIARFALIECLIAATLLTSTAGAVELSISRFTKFEHQLPGDDFIVIGGGSCDTCTVLQSGAYVASIPFRADYGVGGSPPENLYASFEGLTGGTVGFGYVSGSILGSLTTRSNNQNLYEVSFRGSFLDTVTISNPVLTGQPGILTGSVQLHVVPTSSAIASPTDPAEQFGVEIQWNVSGLGAASAAASGWQVDLDGSDPTDFHSIQGGTSGSPVPTTMTVPILTSFTFGDPFDWGLEFGGVTFGGGLNNGTPGEPAWRANSELNFRNTLVWQGIDSVTDGAGNPVSYTISAASLTDWTQPASNPVPEPGVASLVAAGILGIALRARVRGASVV